MTDFDFNGIVARVAVYENDGFIFCYQFHVPSAAIFVVGSSALDGLRVGILGVGEVVEELEREAGHDDDSIKQNRPSGFTAGRNGNSKDFMQPRGGV